jgi:outer membrane protein OmpA-like peptidoglycan-associated protein
MNYKVFSMIVLAIVSFNAFSYDGPYWTDENGNIVRSGFGKCVRTITWTPEDAIEECDGNTTKAAAPADSDGDGVADDADKCPNSPGDKPVDADGCTLVSVVLENVQFEFNSSELTAGSSESLDKVVDAMNEYSTLRIEVQAHSDNSGDAAYNQSLSEERANSVRDYLIAKGIAPDRIEAKGYGESQPIADNDTREGRAANRRVELKVIE